MPDDRLRAALARLVLPEGITTYDLRTWSMYCDRVALPVTAEGLRHIADALDGPLAEAWERSVRAGAAEYAWSGLIKWTLDAARSALTGEEASEPPEGPPKHYDERGPSEPYDLA